MAPGSVFSQNSTVRSPPRSAATCGSIGTLTRSTSAVGLPWKRSDIPVTWPGAAVEVVLAVLVVALVVDAVEAAGPDGAPPPGEVGLVGASVHAAVTAHARPSQAGTILVDIVQTARIRAERRPGPPAGRAVL